MNKQPILLSVLLIINTLNLTAQPQNAFKDKEYYSELFHKKKDQVYETRPGRMESANYGEVKIYAVVVGVGKYTTMPQLQFTDDDARLFYNHLTSYEGGALPPSQIRLLVDGSATRANILKALELMSRRADANDVFVFYFSGHGLPTCFLPVDYTGYKNQLCHDEVLQILNRSRAKHKLCIADACHSGGLDFDGNWASKGTGALQLQDYYSEFEKAGAGTALLMSSRAGEVALEDPRLRHGVFTYFLLRGMTGDADFDQNQIVDIKELYYYVYHQVREHTEGAQSPVLAGDYDDDMPVAIGIVTN